MGIENYLKQVNLSELDCFYADLRIEEESGVELGYKNNELENFSPLGSVGAFLRVYNNGKWFYRSLTELDRIPEAFEDLIHQSKQIKGTNEDLFGHVPVQRDEILKFVKNDPRNISLTEKKELCESYFDLTNEIPEVREYKIYYKDRYQKRAFKSNRGREFIYDYVDYGIFLIFTLRDGDFIFKDANRLWGQNISDLSGKQQQAKKFIEESRRHLKAPIVKPGKYTVLMNSDVVGVFTHESFGHKSEADFMLGDKAAIDEWKIGTKVASDIVSIVDDGNEIINSGYCPIDDEGIPSKKTYLVKNGVLSGRLHSLSTASAFKEEPTGNARAMNFEFEPIVRMTNTYIEAGKDSTESLISSISEGIFVSDYRHGSGLSTFTIAPTRAYEIKNGKIGNPIKVSVISGTVFETLNNIQAVSKGLEIHSSAFGGCGKDEQAPLRVADGGPMIIVKDMQVG
ncbi:MAG: TldD/PmbA family protein [Oligoflexia bacterium]|nr:TldD/PmbA family protein [Oligoflexia bacterium]